jgi:phosphonate transport system substrate-binding protein
LQHPNGLIWNGLIRNGLLLNGLIRFRSLAGDGNINLATIPIRVWRGCVVGSFATTFAIMLFATLVSTMAIAASTDWRKDIGIFRIGIVAGDDIQRTRAKIEPFRLAMAEALGLNVEIFAAKNYHVLINAHAAARIEYAIYSATAYAAAWKICQCVQPIALPISSDGSRSYKSVIIAAQSGPKSVAELVNSNLTGLSQSSFAGYKFAAFELGSAGVELPANIEFSSSGEQAIRQLMAGKYDALIGWSSLTGKSEEGYSEGTLRLIAELNNGQSAPYRMIWESSPIPHRPHAIRKSLAPEAKFILREVLGKMYQSDPVAYDSIEPVFGGGFVPARHEQFLPIIAYVNSLVPDKEKDSDTKTPPPKSQ